MVDISRIELGELDKDELERVKLMLDITKIQADIAESRSRMDTNKATIEQMRQDGDESRTRINKHLVQIDQMRADTKKLEKEVRLYPFVTLAAAMIGGLVVFILTKLLQ